MDLMTVGRKAIWEEVIDLKKGVVAPVLIMGDFNEILNPEERKG